MCFSADPPEKWLSTPESKRVRNGYPDPLSRDPSQSELGVCTEAVIDPNRDHYEVLYVGWDGQHRAPGTLIHIDLIGDKVWIQHDGTSPDVSEGLVEAGIPREAVVLGFLPAQVHEHTGYAFACS